MTATGVYRDLFGLYRVNLKFLLALVTLVFIPVGLATIVTVALVGAAERASTSLLGEGIPADWLATTTVLILTTPF